MLSAQYMLDRIFLLLAFYSWVGTRKKRLLWGTEYTQALQPSPRQLKKKKPKWQNFFGLWSPKELRPLRDHTRIARDSPDSLTLVWAVAAREKTEGGMKTLAHAGR